MEPRALWARFFFKEDLHFKKWKNTFNDFRFKQDFFSFQHLAEIENLLQSIQSTLLNKEKFFEEKYSPKLNNLYLVS